MLEIMVISIAIILTFSISSNIKKCLLIKQSFHSEKLKGFAALPAIKKLEKNLFYQQCTLIVFKLSGIIAITVFLIRGGL